MLNLLAKLFVPIFGGLASNFLRIGIITIILGLGGFAWVTQHDSKLYKKAIDSCPPQTVITGNNNIIDQRLKKMRCFPIAVGKWGFGVCHD